MSFPGFVPVRQLVLVDLLALVVGVRPGERAIVAVDGVDEVSRRQVVTGLLALAERLAGRDLTTVAMDRFRHPGAVETLSSGDGSAYYRDGFDYAACAKEVLRPFRDGSGDGILLIDGVFLHRPELVSRWDASVFVRSGADVAAPMKGYLEQSPDLQATWVLDDTTPAAPLLTFGATVE